MSEPVLTSAGVAAFVSGLIGLAGQTLERRSRRHREIGTAVWRRSPRQKSGLCWDDWV